MMMRNADVVYMVCKYPLGKAVRSCKHFALLLFSAVHASSSKLIGVSFVVRRRRRQKQQRTIYYMQGK